MKSSLLLRSCDNSLTIHPGVAIDYQLFSLLGRLCLAGLVALKNNYSFSILQKLQRARKCQLKGVSLGCTCHFRYLISTLTIDACIWQFACCRFKLLSYATTFYLSFKATIGRFHLHLLVFSFVYQFNSRIGALVNPSFANDQFRRISTTFQHHFKVCLL